MIELVFITMLVIGVVFQLVSIYWESWIFSVLCIIWFLKLAIDSLNIEQLVVYQPTAVNNSLVNGSYEMISTPDYGMNIILLVFVFLNLILAIYFRMGNTLTKRIRL